MSLSSPPVLCSRSNGPAMDLGEESTESEEDGFGESLRAVAYEIPPILVLDILGSTSYNQ